MKPVRSVTMILAAAALAQAPAAEKGWREELKVTYRRSAAPAEGAR